MVLAGSRGGKYIQNFNSEARWAHGSRKMGQRTAAEKKLPTRFHEASIRWMKPNNCDVIRFSSGFAKIVTIQLRFRLERVIDDTGDYTVTKHGQDIKFAPNY